MKQETLLILGVFFGSFLVANYVLGMKAPKKAEPMSNAGGGVGRIDKQTGGCKCGRGVVGYCGSNVDCKTCCANYSFSGASGCGCSGYSGMGGCCGA